MTCIYCLSEKVPSEFNREHVLPRSMGMFRDNLVLSEVCTDCNSSFGSTLDLSLGRNSLEAFQRFQYGIKSKKDLGDLQHARIRFRASPGYGPDSGCYLQLCQDGEEFVVKPMAQVGFPGKGSGDYEYVLLENLEDESCEFTPDYLNSEFRILGPNDEAVKRVLEVLKKRGYKPKVHGAVAPPVAVGDKMETSIEADIDRTMRRAMAKIGYNYFAYSVISQGQRELLLHDGLKQTREYVLGVTDGSFDPVDVDCEPILKFDTLQCVRRAHISYAQIGTT
ncbi:MAG: HNH endonuclease [Cyanobacteriota/Melainabacteria group bacterium]